jgi:outer membrane receptor protein involved in Fe transport
MRAAVLSVCVSVACFLDNSGIEAVAQTQLPQVVITPQPKPSPTARKRKTSDRAHPAQRVVTPRRPTAPPSVPSPSPEAVTAANFKKLDDARANISPPAGANTYTLGRPAIEALPQGADTTVDKVLLQAPGVSQDSAASGQFHVRNEHANVQYRINGILLPDGVSGFGQVLETGLIGNISLLTGALPAQYGLHTSGIVDIQTRSGAFNNGGSVTMTAGSRQTITPSFEYGGTVGNVQYFATGRYFASNQGIENPTSSLNPIHDYTWQGRFFGYASALIDDNTRLSYITGTSLTKFQIPNNPGQTPVFTAFGVSDFDSSLLNERQWERNYYNVIALQKSVNGMDFQLAYFNRYSSVYFSPDPIGDLVFNGVASNVYRRSELNGVQADAAYQVNDAHTLRGGVMTSVEQTKVSNLSTVLPLDDSGNPIDAPLGILDSTSKTGTLFGVYIQDEWRLTHQLTLNLGVRFDQMVQFVDANQVSPRFSLVYKPFDGTTFHAGYARYFTPPSQVIATPANFALFNNTTQQPAVAQSDPVLPERSHYFDAGVTQKVLPGLEIGVDVYYKRAKDLLDDGQFGAALVVDGFNYAKAENAGVELKATYENGNFKAYGNFAAARQVAENVVSNQFLFDPDELAYISNHYIHTDHAQTYTGSGGFSYLLAGTRYSADMIYGSGLRSGFANTDHVPPYTQFNVGASREIQVPNMKLLTVRVAVINVFDKIYELRDGSGIGVFAPQFGPRRGYFLSLTQKL